jgi:hypothetical protein
VAGGSENQRAPKQAVYETEHERRVRLAALDVALTALQPREASGGRR